MCKVYIALQELKVVLQMLCWMVLCLLCKVVGLHLDNNTAKTSFHNEDGTVSFSIMTHLLYIGSG